MTKSKNILAKKGSGWIQRGHRIHTVNGKNKPLHQIIAENALGHLLPSGAIVHHADGNGLNNENSNLVICPNNSYHRLLHMRMRAMKETGNPNLMRCTFCKTYDEPSNMRHEKSGRYVHPVCSNTARMRRYHERKNHVD